MDPKYAIELCGLTILNDRKRDASRKYAVKNINLKIPFNGRSIIFGIPEAGKTVIKKAIIEHQKYKNMVKVKTNLKEIPLTVEHREWGITDYRKEFYTIDPNLFVIVDEFIDSAIEFLLDLPNGMLIFAGNDGYKHIKQFGKNRGQVFACKKQGSSLCLTVQIFFNDKTVKKGVKKRGQISA